MTTTATTTAGRRARRSTAALLGLALGAATLGASPPPTAAADGESDTLVFVSYQDGAPSVFVRDGTRTEATYIPARDAIVEGDFSAAPGTDLFLYGVGAAADGIVHVDPDGATTAVRPEAVSGSYTPLAGDFDGNGLDDILWYGWGAAADSIWLFQPDGSHETVWFTVSGHYQPVVLDSDGDGHDDVIWYGYGPDPDSMWVFGPDATYTKRSVRIDGRYQPLVGDFGAEPSGAKEQVLWYAVRGPDALWTFSEHGKTSRSLPNEDDAEPVVGRFGPNDNDAVYWYRPGAAVDTTYGFDEGGAPIPIPQEVPVPQVRGQYIPEVGDFDGDGAEDIAWTRRGEATIWHADPTILSYRQTTVSTGRTATLPAVTHPTVVQD